MFPLSKMHPDEIAERFEPERKPRKDSSRASTIPKTDYFRRKSCSNKRRFKSLEEAKDFRTGLEYHRRREDRPFDPNRIYYCGICNGYHMTSITGQADFHTAV